MGGYRDLEAFKMAELVYDGTVRFCELFMDKRSRTVDQMFRLLEADGRTLPKAAWRRGLPRRRS